MEKLSTPDFIVIDDDSINNHICQKYIQLIFPDADIVTFISPVAGLEYIQTKYPITRQNDTILLLDINMPVLSGWDVLDRFINFPEGVKRQFKIYILSSSIAIEDKVKSNNNPLVSGFIEKPLNISQLRNLFKDYL